MHPLRSCCPSVSTEGIWAVECMKKDPSLAIGRWRNALRRKHGGRNCADDATAPLADGGLLWCTLLKSEVSARLRAGDEIMNKWAPALRAMDR